MSTVFWINTWDNPENVPDMENKCAPGLACTYDMCVCQSGPLFYWHLYKIAQMKNNKVDNFETIFCTLALMFVEMNSDEVLIDSFRFALGIQVRLKRVT